MSDFSVFTMSVDGQDVEFKVKKPNGPQKREGQSVYVRTFKENLKAGAMIKAQLETYLRENGIWGEEQEMQYQTLQREVRDNLQKLEEGGFDIKKARKLAIATQKKRGEMVELIFNKSQLEDNTAEGQANNMRFNYYVSCCLVYNTTGKPYFSSLDDYLEKSETLVANRGAQELASLLYDYSDNIRTLPENEFLVEFGFADDELRLINENEEFVDEAGKVIKVEEVKKVERKPFTKNGKPVEFKNKVAEEVKVVKE